MRPPAAVLAALLAAVALGGCETAGIEAPLPHAEKINALTSTISSACGLLEEYSAFPPAPHREVVKLMASAEGAVVKLAAIDRAHADWRFDGVEMGTIVNQARTMLRSCGLKAAAEELKRDTAH